MLSIILSSTLWQFPGRVPTLQWAREARWQNDVARGILPCSLILMLWGQVHFLNYTLRWRVISSQPSPTWQMKPWFSTDKHFRAKPGGSQVNWKTDCSCQKQTWLGRPGGCNIRGSPRDPQPANWPKPIKVLSLRLLKRHAQDFLGPSSLNISTVSMSLFEAVSSFAKADGTTSLSVLFCF